MTLDALVRGIAPDPGPGITPGAAELMREITALSQPALSRPALSPLALSPLALSRLALSPLALSRLALARMKRLLMKWPRTRRPRTRRLQMRRLWIGAAGVFAALLTWSLPLTGPAAAALDIHRDGDFYVVTVKNVYAEPTAYARQLRAWGLNVAMEVVPAAPNMVGTILPVEHETPAQITSIQARGACARINPYRCVIAIRIPVAYRGSAEIFLGRAARPGETYRMPGPVRGPGELLDCLPVHGERVGTIRSLVVARGVRVTKVLDVTARFSAVPDSWYVETAVLVADHAVIIGALPYRPEPYPVNLDGC